MPLMLALQSLNGSVADATFAHWCDLARSIVPARAYRGWPHAGGNWAIVALTGEYIRYTLGLRANIDDIIEQLRYQYNPEVDRSPAPLPNTCILTPSRLVCGLQVWTANGEYQDHSGCSGACNPMPYDHFPRKYIAVMLGAWARGAVYACRIVIWPFGCGASGAWLCGLLMVVVCFGWMIALQRTGTQRRTQACTGN
jgi:hypothetical protein